MRARKKNWVPAELATNPRIARDPAAFQGRWHEYFGNDHPLDVEIGCGKGRFIAETARRDSCVNCIAMERESQVVAQAARLAKTLPAECGLAFVIGDAKDMPEYFAAGEIRRLYINFCDPWPVRKKWQKRRLTHPNFLRMYRSLFRERGEIHFKTDNKELFGFSLDAFAENGWRLRNVTHDLLHSGFANNIMTEYEEKFTLRGLPIYRCEAYWGNYALTASNREPTADPHVPGP